MRETGRLAAGAIPPNQMQRNVRAALKLFGRVSRAILMNNSSTSFNLSGMAKSLGWSGQATSSMPVIIAIDVGYGYVKYAEPTDQGFSVSAFPSFAPVAESGDLGVSDSIMVQRDTRVVRVNNSLYEVGPDSQLAQSVTGSRELDENYIEKDEYRAKFYGALSYIGKTHIDTLITGLPVNHARHAEKVEKLKSIFTGTHHISDKLTVTIDNVRVVPQPLGGLIEHALRSHSLAEIKKCRNLTIDPGQRTFDWLMTEGLKPIYQMSDSHTTSMQKVISAIERNISNFLQTHYNGSTYIEKAISDGTIKLHGTSYPIDQFITDKVMKITNEAVNKMKGQLDDIDKIDNVFIVGGGADFFKNAVSLAFPSYKIIKNDNSIYDNVKGYYLSGCLTSGR